MSLKKKVTQKVTHSLNHKVRKPRGAKEYVSDEKIPKYDVSH